jgi:hypothetical protein
MTERHWSQTEVGVVATSSGLFGLALQTPIGAAIDLTPAKRGAAGADVAGGSASRQPKLQRAHHLVIAAQSRKAGDANHISVIARPTRRSRQSNPCSVTRSSSAFYSRAGSSNPETRRYALAAAANAAQAGHLINGDSLLVTTTTYEDAGQVSELVAALRSSWRHGGLERRP